MATVTDFLTAYPEFSAAVTESPGLIEQHLVDATANTNAVTMDDKAEEAIKLRCAITLMESPWARALRLEDPKANARREQRLRNMQETQTALLRIFI